MACCPEQVAIDLPDIPWLHFRGPGYDGDSLFTLVDGSDELEEWSAADLSAIRTISLGFTVAMDYGRGATASPGFFYFLHLANDGTMKMYRVDLSTEAVSMLVDFGLQSAEDVVFCPSDGRLYVRIYTGTAWEVQAYTLAGVLDETIDSTTDLLWTRPQHTADGGVWYGVDDAGGTTVFRYDTTAGTISTHTFPLSLGSFSPTAFMSNGEVVWAVGITGTDHVVVEFASGVGEGTIVQQVDQFDPDVVTATSPNGIVYVTSAPSGTACPTFVRVLPFWNHQDEAGVGWSVSNFGSWGRLWRFAPCPAGGLTVGFLRLG